MQRGVSRLWMPAVQQHQASMIYDKPHSLPLTMLVLCCNRESTPWPAHYKLTRCQMAGSALTRQQSPYQDAGFPQHLQVVVQAQHLPVGGDCHQHLLAWCPHQLTRSCVYISRCQRHYMHACTSTKQENACTPELDCARVLDHMWMRQHTLYK